MKEGINQDETNESYSTVEPKGNRKLDKPDSRQKALDTGTSKASNLENSWFTPRKPMTQANLKNLVHSLTTRCNQLRASQGMSTLYMGTCTQAEMTYGESLFHQMGIHGILQQASGISDAASKSPTMSSSDSEESGDAKSSTQSTAPDDEKNTTNSGNLGHDYL